MLYSIEYTTLGILGICYRCEQRGKLNNKGRFSNHYVVVLKSVYGVGLCQNY